MELRQLRQLVILAETLNFRRAAERLHMSQPPLSVSIRKLEEELGVRLLNRAGRRVSLTAEGEAALTYAKDALSAVEMLSQAVRATTQGQLGRLRAGFVASATYALVPAAVRLFRSRFPAVEISLNETTTLDALRALQGGDLDLAIVRTPVLDAPGVRLETLSQEELVLIAPRDHPLAAGREAARLEEFKAEPFVTYDRRHVPNLWTVAALACEAAGFLPIVAEQATHMHTLLALVESGLGVALAPAGVWRAGTDRVRHLRLTTGGEPVVVGLAAATHIGEQGVLAASFLSVLREVASTS